ncbi:lysylphosphatidylglycerol synthetase [Pelomyxa schiedti]|nr:lysylphosphatidylglycerol synthetase [Pelomyxa schiedti]
MSTNTTVSTNALGVEHMNVVQQRLATTSPCSSEMSFTTCHANRLHRPIHILNIGAVVVAFVRVLGDGRLLVFGDPFVPVEEIVSALGSRLAGFERITVGIAKQLEALGFPPSRDRDSDDYVYQCSDLAELPGNKYSKKRAWVKKALDTYRGRIETEDLSISNIAGCIELLNSWCDKKNCATDRSMCGEYHATLDTLTNWELFAPALFGTVIRIDGKVEAFCVGERLNPTMAICHFEKANVDLVGMAQLINKMFADKLKSMGITFINREEDCGSEGLRQAKQSYHPHHMVEKFKVNITPETPCAFTCQSKKCFVTSSEDIEDL